jgi:hypothetical protein
MGTVCHQRCSSCAPPHCPGRTHLGKVLTQPGSTKLVNLSHVLQHHARSPCREHADRQASSLPAGAASCAVSSHADAGVIESQADRAAQASNITSYLSKSVSSTCGSCSGSGSCLQRVGVYRVAHKRRSHGMAQPPLSARKSTHLRAREMIWAARCGTNVAFGAARATEGRRGETTTAARPNDVARVNCTTLISRWTAERARRDRSKRWQTRVWTVSSCCGESLPSLPIECLRQLSNAQHHRL